MQVHVVPHTHWDREWYLPFSVYRSRLVRLLDSLLEALESEPALRFHLDGQMAVVDDYLEIRPDQAAPLRRAAAEGRVSLGPWYTLPDEHLVSGESLLRNLEMGMRRARDFGEPMLVGYLPDQFGHTAQMPQILNRYGIDTALLWRGVPAAMRARVFRWAALDGSEVEAVHLKTGYGHGRELPIDPAALGARIDAEVAAATGADDEGPWLLMSGDDHLPVPVGLAAALPAAKSARVAAISSVEDYARTRPRAGGRWEGELHSAASSYVLKGTLSARFPLKLRHAALERRVERYLEPAWALSGRPWPQRPLAYIWRQLVLNSAHDSICGCSIDQVHEQATIRLARAERAADQLWAELGATPGSVFNPSPFERDGVPPVGIGRAPHDVFRALDVGHLGIALEEGGDRGDEYTYDPPSGTSPFRTPVRDEATVPAEGVTVHLKGWTDGGPIQRLEVVVENLRTDHRLRLVVPADTSRGATAGVAFGAAWRGYRASGTEAGIEYDLRTDPARGWVDAGGVTVMLRGPFEYELLEDGIAVTLLRCVGWLSRGDLKNRPAEAGPTLSTPGAQMLGSHRLEVAVFRHDGDWEEAQVPRWYEVYAHPLVPAPAELASRGPEIEDPAVLLSALRRVGGHRLLRVYRCGTRGADPPPFRIEDRLLDHLRGEH